MRKHPPPLKVLQRVPSFHKGTSGVILTSSSLRLPRSILSLPGPSTAGWEADMAPGMRFPAGGRNDGLEKASCPPGRPHAPPRPPHGLTGEPRCPPAPPPQSFPPLPLPVQRSERRTSNSRVPEIGLQSAGSWQGQAPEEPGGSCWRRKRKKKKSASRAPRNVSMRPGKGASSVAGKPPLLWPGEEGEAAGRRFLQEGAQAAPGAAPKRAGTAGKGAGEAPEETLARPGGPAGLPTGVCVGGERRRCPWRVREGVYFVAECEGSALKWDAFLHRKQ